jgi:hypothetical protein
MPITLDGSSLTIEKLNTAHAAVPGGGYWIIPAPGTALRTWLKYILNQEPAHAYHPRWFISYH